MPTSPAGDGRWVGVGGLGEDAEGGVGFDEDGVELVEVCVGDLEAGGVVVDGAAHAGGGVDPAGGEVSGGGFGAFEAEPLAGADLEFGAGLDAVEATGEEVAFFEVDGEAADVEGVEVEVEAEGVFDEAEGEGSADDFDAGEGFEVAGVEGGVDGFEEGGGDLVVVGEFEEGVAALDVDVVGEGVFGEECGAEEDGGVEGGELGAELVGAGGVGGGVGELCEGGVEGGAAFEDAAGVEGGGAFGGELEGILSGRGGGVLFCRRSGGKGFGGDSERLGRGGLWGRDIW